MPAVGRGQRDATVRSLTPRARDGTRSCVSQAPGGVAVERIAAVDLFCGAGGLTHGLQLAGVPVVAGVDLDPACRYPYEANNGAQFIERDIHQLSAAELQALFGDARFTVLAGCAPCQPFSTYTQRYAGRGADGRWGLLYEFSRLATATRPDVIAMENVPSLQRHAVFADFAAALERRGYWVRHAVVESWRYGVPQVRRRLVMLASRHGPLALVEPTHAQPRTVRQVIGRMERLAAGEAARRDPVHVASRLSAQNLRRIRASSPGGTWREWPPELIADCHRADSGRTFGGVYGRMSWDAPAPTITTQCYGYGNGRFGHPSQDRAISLREAALLQSFPRRYAFVPEGEAVSIRVVGRLIGNAVPVALGRAVGASIRAHLEGLR